MKLVKMEPVMNREAINKVIKLLDNKKYELIECREEIESEKYGVLEIKSEVRLLLEEGFELTITQREQMLK